MAMRLTVLGGAAAWPNPGQGCSSYLVEHGSTEVVLDCGPATLPELRRHTDYTRISAIVISHCHSDHILDLVPYRYGLVYGPTRPPRRIPLWLPPGGLDRLDMLGAAFDGQGEPYNSFWQDVFELQEYNPRTALRFGEMRFTFTPTQHFIPCYAVRVDAAGSGSIGYTADTGAIDPLVESFSGVTALIAEATLAEHDGTPKSERGHLTPEDAAELAARAGADTLVMSHLWSERPDDTVRSIGSQYFSGKIEIAKPGLTIDV
jgi:ribonuclease BN (tRNA processing enzyme)